MNPEKEYLSVLIAILNASLVYLYARRNNNSMNSHIQDKESLEELVELMYLRLKSIVNVENRYKKRRKFLKII